MEMPKNHNSNFLNRFELEDRIDKGKDLERIIKTARINKIISYWLVFITELFIYLFISYTLSKVLFKTSFFAPLSRKQYYILVAFLAAAIVITMDPLKRFFDKLLLKRVERKVNRFKKEWNIDKKPLRHKTIIRKSKNNLTND